jgi:hypothetical protein
MKIPRKASFQLPSLRLHIPIGGGIYLGGGKLILASLSTVALGFIASLFLLVSRGDPELVWPSLGAEYTAPSMVGQRVVDAESPEERSQTLQLNLPAGLRISKIHFTNIQLGRGGLAVAFQITGFNTTSSRIVVETLTIRNSEFPTMDFANSDFGTFNATSSVVAAGHTFSPTITTTASVVVGSDRGASSYVAEDMVVDRIIITQSSAGGDVLIGEIILDGVRAHTGSFDLDNVEAGTVTLENIRVGDDGDLNSADLILNSSVTVGTMNDGVTEERIQIR